MQHEKFMFLEPCLAVADTPEMYLEKMIAS
jgi:hypothetical protein